jgi:starch phosphorylase
VPRAVIIAGKAAPSYFVAKRIIALVHAFGDMIRKEPTVARRLNLIFVPNYDVSTAEMVFPATDLSEQISTAGTEASGTGCMKAIMNGGVIIGTLDGANIEIRDEVGAANMFTFGHTAEEIAAMHGVGPVSDDARRVIDTISRLGFESLANTLLNSDRYFHCADFGSYIATQRQAAHTWLHADDWTPMSILNVARSGYFSADRTVAEYAKEIWGLAD